MSNYHDQEATRQVEIGPCRCPVDPKPHPTDTADVRVRFGWGERQAIEEAGSPSAVNLAGLLAGVKRWNLVLPDGSARNVDRLQLILLDDFTVNRLVEELRPAMEDEPLPNSSSAPSPDGSLESATPTPTSPSSTETSPDSTTT